MTRETFRYALRIFAANVAASTLVAVAFGGVALSTPWRDGLRVFGIAFLFSNCIGIPVAAALPRLGRRVWDRVAFPGNWMVMIAAMMVLAVAGSVLAITTLMVFGAVPASDFVEWFAGSLRISLITTVTIGIVVTGYELMRARLDQATIALRTKERDEAEARRLATEAQLASLESRVQPHFLFNTLNSIAALIPGDPAGAERMTAQLATLLRSSLDAGGAPLVPLDEELAIVRDYLAIERVRFGDRLRVEIGIDEHAGRTPVPRLSLQTLVENSVKFAVSPRPGGASIVIRATMTGGRVRIDVEDDGPGFGSMGVPAGHGLALLDARLKMLYGNRATLKIDSQPARSIVAIELPREP